VFKNICGQVALYCFCTYGVAGAGVKYFVKTGNIEIKRGSGRPPLRISETAVSDSEII
jgi:hypothetical protein